MDYGSRKQQKPVLIPTGDEEILQISEHRHKLSQFFLFSIADHDLLQSLVDKCRFYQLVKMEGYAHALTFFPDSLTEVETIGRDLDCPFLIKPSSSLAFQEKFKRKCFVIENRKKLDWAIRALEGTGLRVLIQEIVPGNEFHEVSVYFNRLGKPVAACGWDRLRQFPTGFGNATLCRNVFRPEPVELSEAFLRGLGFRGLAAVEFKRDPRDNQFKIIEVNPRTTLQNRLAAACGADMEWIAYQDLVGQEVTSIQPPNTGVIWVDDFTDLVSGMSDMMRGNFVPKQHASQKVRSIACWDDPLPLLARMFFLFLNAIRLLRSRFGGKMSRVLFRRSHDAQFGAKPRK